MAYNYGGNNPRFTGQPQNQPYTAGMPYFQQQGLPNQRPAMQQGMQFNHAPQQPQGYQGGFGQGQLHGNPNPQIQQAFHQQQYQKMMQQQQRMAQENQKMENETRKKREFEMQQKRLQEFGRHGGGKKAGGGDLSRLIGSLAGQSGGSKPAPKHLTSSSGRSLFARPGGSYQAPQTHDIPTQQQQSQHPEHTGQPHVQQHSGQLHVQQHPGQLHLQKHHGQQQFPENPGQPHIQQHTGQSHFPQLPGLSHVQQHPYQNQQTDFGTHGFEQSTGADDEFSDFQEAQPSIPGQGCVIPGQGGMSSSVVSSSMSSVMPNISGPTWPSQSGGHTQNNPSWQTSQGTTSTIGGKFNPNQMVSGSNMQPSTFHGTTTNTEATSVMPSMGSASMITGPRPRTESQSSVSSNSSGGFQSSQGGHTIMTFQGGHTDMNSGFQSFGQSQNQMSNVLPGMQNTSFMAQGLNTGPTMMPGLPGQEFNKDQPVDVSGQVMAPGSDGDSSAQEEPEDAVEKLYGIDVPDWCTTGSDLPGVYKDVKDAATQNGIIDTGTLYPILLSSELNRDILGQLWSKVNKATPGQLNDMELRMMLGLIALGQTGLKVERLTLEKLATCNSAPIPSFPEDIFKPKETSWSFQEEPDKESKEDTSTLPVIGTFVGWQAQPSNVQSNPTETNDKYNVFRMDNTSTYPPSVPAIENIGSFSTGNWSLPGKDHLTPNRQAAIQGTHMLGQDQGIKLSSSPEFQGFQSAEGSSEIRADFGDFQGSISSLDSIGGMSQQSGQSGVASDCSSKLAASLDNCKLKIDTQEPSAVECNEFASFLSAETVTTSKSSMSSHGDGSHGDGSHGDGNYGNKPNASATFPSIRMPPQESKTGDSTASSFPNISMPSSSVKPESKVESGWGTSAEIAPAIVSAGQESTQKTTDKYDFLRELESSTPDNAETFSLPQASRKKDDSFGDFETFERAMPSAADDFRDFQTTVTESVPSIHNLGSLPNTKQSEGWGFDGLSTTGTQLSKAEGDFANFEHAPFSGANVNPVNILGTAQSQDDFGDFADFQSSTSSTLPSGPTKVNDIPSLFSLNSSQEINGQLKNSFGDQTRQRSSSTASNSFTNTVPLDSTQRYKLLSDEGEDVDKHGNVWGRCLNSCLLTLVTGALAVQKMSDPSLKQEVLQSKKGIEYFTAITEVYWVTQRIQVSLMKTDFVNDKLKDIFVEINQSWKTISNFLVRSKIEANLGREDYSDHHIQGDEDKSMACGVCLLNVNKSTGDTKLSYGGRQYHATCANFWCNRVDSILPSLLPVNSLI